MHRGRVRILRRMEVRLLTPAEVADATGVHRTTQYRRTKRSGALELSGGRMLVIDGELINDETELVSVLSGAPSRADMAALQARVERLEQQLQLARHEQELAAAQSAGDQAALSEIVARASDLLRNQLARGGAPRF